MYTQSGSQDNSFPPTTITFQQDFQPRSDSQATVDVEANNAEVSNAELEQIPTIQDRQWWPRSIREAPVKEDLKKVTWPRDVRAYCTLFACFLCMFNSWGLVNAYGTFLSYYKDTLLSTTDNTLLNLIGTTQCFMVLIFSATVGRLLDAGYYPYLTGGGWVFLSIGMFSLSQTADLSPNGVTHIGSFGSIWATQGLTAGIGMACLFVSSSQIASTWFIGMKSFAIGIVACGASIAGVIYPLAIRFLIKALGWEKAMLCLGGIISATALLSFILAIPNPDHQIRIPHNGQWLSKRVWVDTKAFRNSAYLWFVAAIAIMFFGFYAIFFNLEEWSVASGVGFEEQMHVIVTQQYSESNPIGLQTYYLLCIMNGASTLGRLGAAYASDHFGAVMVHAIVTFIASMFTFFLWTFANQLDIALAFVVLFGAFSGAVIGLPPASVANILGPRPSQQAKLGQWTGQMYTAAAPFALTGPVIAGYLIQHYGTFLTVQMWSGSCLLLASCCMAMSAWCIHKQAPPEDDEAESKLGMTPSGMSSNTVSADVSRFPSRKGSVGADEEKVAL